MARRFSLFRRSGCGGYYYVQLKDPATGAFLPAKSTGKKDESEALLVVADWLNNGVPQRRANHRRNACEVLTIEGIVQTLRTAELTEYDTRRIVAALRERGVIESAVISQSGPASEPLISYLEHFWNYDESEYVRERIAYGHSIGRRHCADSLNRLSHWRAHFGSEITVGAVTRDMLREFQLQLHAKGLAPKTINLIMHSGGVAFSWLAGLGKLDTDPSAGLRKFAGKSKKRSVLTATEATRVFKVTWKDKRARVGNLIAMTTGARAGEILALRIGDVGTDRLHIRHSWSRDDKLKSTKTDEERSVPLLPKVRSELRELIESNPFGKNSELFIFYGPDRSAPMSHNILRRGLAEALVDMTLNKRDRKKATKRAEVRKQFAERGVVFHSRRHYFAAHLIMSRCAQATTL